MLNGKTVDDLLAESLRLARIVLAKLDGYAPLTPADFESDAHVIANALVLAFGDGITDASSIFGPGTETDNTRAAAERHQRNNAAFYQTDSIH